MSEREFTQPSMGYLKDFGWYAHDHDTGRAYWHDLRQGLPTTGMHSGYGAELAAFMAEFDEEVEKCTGGSSER